MHPTAIYFCDTNSDKNSLGTPMDEHPGVLKSARTIAGM
jgi:hypothetical protein